MADNTTKRRVKNPETFRERANKAAEGADRPAKRHRLRAFIAKPIGWVLRPAGRFLKFAFYRQPFLLLRRPLRIIAKVLFLPYFASSLRELKQVRWPTWSESRQLTLAVILFAAIFGAIISGVDWGLDKIFKHLLLK